MGDPFTAFYSTFVQHSAHTSAEHALKPSTLLFQRLAELAWEVLDVGRRDGIGDADRDAFLLALHVADRATVHEVAPFDDDAVAQVADALLALLPPHLREARDDSPFSAADLLGMGRWIRRSLASHGRMMEAAVVQANAYRQAVASFADTGALGDALTALEDRADLTAALHQARRRDTAADDEDDQRIYESAVAALSSQFDPRTGLPQTEQALRLAVAVHRERTNATSILATLGDPARAAELARSQADTWIALAEIDPSLEDDAAAACANLGAIELAAGNVDLARRALSDAVAMADERAADGHPRSVAVLASALLNLAEWYELDGDTDGVAMCAFDVIDLPVDLRHRGTAMARLLAIGRPFAPDAARPVVESLLAMSEEAQAEVLRYGQADERGALIATLEGLASLGFEFLVRYGDLDDAMGFLDRMLGIELRLVSAAFDPDLASRLAGHPGLLAQLRDAVCLGSTISFTWVQAETEGEAWRPSRPLEDILGDIWVATGVEPLRSDVRWEVLEDYVDGDAQLVVAAGPRGGCAVTTSDGAHRVDRLPNLTTGAVALASQALDGAVRVDEAELVGGLLEGLVLPGDVAISLVLVGDVANLPIQRCLGWPVERVSMRPTRPAGASTPLRNWGVVHSPGGIDDGDLEWAEAEARWIAAVTGGELLSGRDLRASDASSLLERVDAFHATCHGTSGVLSGIQRKVGGTTYVTVIPPGREDPCTQGLRLGSDVLHVEDLARDGSGALPRFVCLSACQAGRSEGGDRAVGFPGVLLALGVESVLAPLRPIDDASACRFVSHVYREWARGVPLGDALRRAWTWFEEVEPLNPAPGAFVVFGRTDLLWSDDRAAALPTTWGAAPTLPDLPVRIAERAKAKPDPPRPAPWWGGPDLELPFPDLGLVFDGAVEAYPVGDVVGWLLPMYRPLPEDPPRPINGPGWF